MNYISDIFERLDLQSIREYLLHGGELLEISNRPYRERLEQAQEQATGVLRRKFPDGDEYEEVSSAVYRCSGEIENVYMEIGMQCGASRCDNSS